MGFCYMCILLLFLSLHTLIPISVGQYGQSRQKLKQINGLALTNTLTTLAIQSVMASTANS
jgi:hypothetical protein